MEKAGEATSNLARGPRAARSPSITRSLPMLLTSLIRSYPDKRHLQVVRLALGGRTAERVRKESVQPSPARLASEWPGRPRCSAGPLRVSLRLSDASFLRRDTAGQTRATIPRAQRTRKRVKVNESDARELASRIGSRRLQAGLGAASDAGATDAPFPVPRASPSPAWELAGQVPTRPLPACAFRPKRQARERCLKAPPIPPLHYLRSETTAPRQWRKMAEEVQRRDPFIVRRYHGWLA
jgi:hypothetical protein